MSKEHLHKSFIMNTTKDLENIFFYTNFFNTNKIVIQNIKTDQQTY